MSKCVFKATMLRRMSTEASLSKHIHIQRAECHLSNMWGNKKTQHLLHRPLLRLFIG